MTLPLVELRTYANESYVIGKKSIRTASPAWAVTHVHGRPRYGVFPVTRTSVLGFGALPVTASLHLRQIRRGGQLVPIRIRTLSSTVPPFVTAPTRVNALVTLRLTDVRVDRVPLDVGAHCHSTVPMHLRLRGFAPKYTVFTGGPLSGTETIPSFTGCGTGGDDLDPLITGMISGPGNPLHMVQGALGAWNPKTPHDCSGCKPPAEPTR